MGVQHFMEMTIDMVNCIIASEAKGKAKKGNSFRSKHRIGKCLHFMLVAFSSVAMVRVLTNHARRKR